MKIIKKKKKKTNQYALLCYDKTGGSISHGSYGSQQLPFLHIMGKNSTW